MADRLKPTDRALIIHIFKYFYTNFRDIETVLHYITEGVLDSDFIPNEVKDVWKIAYDLLRDQPDLNILRGFLDE